MDQKGLVPILIVAGVVSVLVVIAGGTLFLKIHPLQKTADSIKVFNGKPEFTQPPISSATPSPTPNVPRDITQPLDLSFKFDPESDLIYSIYDGNDALVFASHPSGKQNKIATIKSANVILLSPDNTKLLYQKNKDSNNLHIYDLTYGSDKSYQIGSGDITIQEVAWNPNGKEIVFILQKNAPEVKDVSTQFDSLDLNTGATMTIDISQTSIKDFNPSKTDTTAHFYASTKQTLYIFGNTPCAPGPCYGPLYSFNWQTHSIKEFRLPDSDEYDTLSDVNPETGEFLLGESGPGECSRVHKLQSYNPVNNSIKTFLNKAGLCFAIYSEWYINDHQILFGSPSGGDKYGLELYKLDWYIFDLNNKSLKKIPFTTNYLQPLDENTGFIADSGYQSHELTLVDFATGKKTNIYQSSNVPFHLMRLYPWYEQ